MHIGFKQNIGPSDRIIRSLFSAALLLLAFFGSEIMNSTWRIALGVIGGFMLIESAAGY